MVLLFPLLIAPLPSAVCHIISLDSRNRSLFWYKLWGYTAPCGFESSPCNPASTVPAPDTSVSSSSFSSFSFCVQPSLSERGTTRISTCYNFNFIFESHAFFTVGSSRQVPQTSTTFMALALTPSPLNHPCFCSQVLQLQLPTHCKLTPTNTEGACEVVSSCEN